MQAGYDDRGGEASHNRGSTGIPLVSATSSSSDATGAGSSKSRASPDIT